MKEIVNSYILAILILVCYNGGPDVWLTKLADHRPLYTSDFESLEAFTSMISLVFEDKFFNDLLLAIPVALVVNVISRVIEELSDIAQKLNLIMILLVKNNDSDNSDEILE